MSPYSLAPSSAAVDAVRLHVHPGGLAFIGLPATATAVDGAWLTPTLAELLNRHERVLLLVESELLSYERCADLHSDAPILRPAAMAERVCDDTMERWRELDAIRHALPTPLLHRVQIASWAHFTDPSFASLWRHLLTAFAVGSAFRRDVLRLGHAQLRRWQGAGAAVQAGRVACLREVESLAMRLRLGEVAGYHHEYGRKREGLLAHKLYAGAYAADGLTVESLVGHPARRQFRRTGEG
jgi:hypothetical protein